ncbi:hypothetical protein NC652_041688 [Populus alba x Populus x berolinensis]|uniref:Uncharacterized protein n=1 Tax=Populus alba x Populus x berolinensis TaxID=444605 RepID=A0AAD6L9N4_9ROSI|nr:hypothetical protein NC652_041688 [Populus alba x Populus x berolinensis]KAJ6952864.1 hypothetical protein NC653_041877 [Populus alba x Populus x berolinensis]
MIHLSRLDRLTKSTRTPNHRPKEKQKTKGSQETQNQTNNQVTTLYLPTTSLFLS